MVMAAAAKVWRLDEVHSLPDDGNKYELIRGELLVTPPPSVAHEGLASALSAVLHPYVQRHGLGWVQRPRAVLRREGNEVEPDLMVRPAVTPLPQEWEWLPIPILVVEILSASTRRRDFGQKRSFYMDIGVPEYWIVDGGARNVRVIRPARHDQVVSEQLSWQPAAAPEALVIDLLAFFRDALG